MIKILAPLVVSSVILSTTTLLQPARITYSVLSYSTPPMAETSATASTAPLKIVLSQPEVIKSQSDIVKDTILAIFGDDAQIAIKISYCESSWKQFDSEGSVLRGIVNPADRGAMQINLMHKDEADKLGLDINTLEGNVRFAYHLFTLHGWNDWLASSGCWKS